MNKENNLQKLLEKSIEEKVEHKEINVNVISDPHNALILSYSLQKFPDIINHKISMVRLDSGCIPDLIEVDWETHKIIAVEAETENKDYRIEKKKINYLKKHFQNGPCSLPFDKLLVITPKDKGEQLENKMPTM